jgi:glycosyltransferase involved in cell wall biosynthesis
MKKHKNIALLHTRLKCIDGVSIESEKWIKAYTNLGYCVHLVAGRFCVKTSRPKLRIPELDFTHPIIRIIKKLAFESKLDKASKEALNALVNLMSRKIKKEILAYVRKHDIHFLSIENAMAIPLNLPLGVALQEISEETGIPIIARHHDFYWERKYFYQHDNIPKILKSSFPPKMKNVVHVTISGIANCSLDKKRKIKATTIPNTIDFKQVKGFDEYNKDFRKNFGINKNQLIFLQPTRITKRKAIERSVEMVAHINRLLKTKNILMITGPSFYGDATYFTKIMRLAKQLGVNIVLAQDRINIKRDKKKGKKIYSIEDAYVNCDVVTFPSEVEGFGNPILEACAYRKPLFVNKFPVFNEINKKKFDFVVMDGKLTHAVIHKMRDVLKDKAKMDKMIDKNYRIAKKNYSQETLETMLLKLLRKSSRGLTDQWKLFLQDMEKRITTLKESCKVN